MSVCVCVFQTRRVYIFKYLEVDGEVFKFTVTCGGRERDIKRMMKKKNRKEVADGGDIDQWKLLD